MESSSVLRSISIVVDADSNDGDESGIKNEGVNIEDEQIESVKGDTLRSATNWLPKEEIFRLKNFILLIEKSGDQTEENEAVEEQKGEQETVAEQEMEPEPDEKQEEIEKAETNGTAEKSNGSVQRQETPTESSGGEKKRANMKKAIEQTMSSILTKNKIEIKIPPIWTPTDKRANAALIYLYFRSVSWH